MTIGELFKDTGIEVASEKAGLSVAHLQYDSRKVQPGDLFIAIRGYVTDGHRFLKMAREQGALAAVVEELNSEIDFTQIKVANTRHIMAHLAQKFYHAQLSRLSLIGITGTNGKTTVSYLMRSILTAMGISCGLAGTIAYWIGNEKLDAWNTTPEAIDLYEMLARMQQAGNQAAVLEVSSHALALNRVEGLVFKVGLFTNLTRDHLDFHGSMESYLADKQKLFSQLDKNGTAVINYDDRYGRKLLKNIDAAVLTFGIEDGADVMARDWDTSARGTNINVQYKGRTFQVSSPLIGEFNVYNVLSAVAVALAYNVPDKAIAYGISQLKHVPGRLENYHLKNGATAIIDYAHTPDAMEKAMDVCRKLTPGKLYVVFGCGGDRDKGKRPLMGEVAARMADHVIITDDNPRTENPRAILQDIQKGIAGNPSHVETIPDRAMAIRHALSVISNGDALLIAGKGHEKYQVIGTEKIPFDEVKIIKEAM